MRIETKKKTYKLLFYDTGKTNQRPPSEASPEISMDTHVLKLGT